MKKYLIVSIILCSVSISNSQWYFFTPNAGGIFKDVFFINNLTGWVVSNYSEVFKTTNSGYSWVRYEHWPYFFYNLIFVNIQTGYAAGYYGHVYKTTNGGANFFEQNSPTTYNLPSIFFLSELTGFAVGYHGTIINTTNGGNEWNMYNSGTDTDFTCIDFPSAQTGYIVGRWGKLLKTTNSGVNWFNVFMGSSIHYSSVFFINNYTGWMLTSHYVVKTINGGYNWISYNYPTQYSFESVFFCNENTGLVVGGGFIAPGIIIKTTDGGQSWYSQTCPVNSALYSVFMLNPDTAFTVSFHHEILNTSNGGEPIGINPINSEVAGSYVLYQNCPNPFNPGTKIKFDIPSNVQSEKRDVKLTVFDVLGREIAALVNGQLQPGTYEVTWNASNYPSGVYFYKLVTGDYTETRKMVLIK